jgi:hypothetical protein
MQKRFGVVGVTGRFVSRFAEVLSSGGELRELVMPVQDRRPGIV